MNTDIINEFLDVLFFQSKDDLEAGCAEERMKKLLGLDAVKYKNITLYLSEKKLITSHPQWLDHIILTHRGISQVLKYRAGKAFVTIQFRKIDYVPSELKKVIRGLLFYYDIIYENERRDPKMIGVFVTDLLCIRWDLQFEGPRLHDTEKILLQFALTTIIARLQKGIPDQREEIVLQANMQPGSCPYDAKKLIDMNYTTYEVSVPSFGNYFSDLHPDSTTTSFNKVPHMRTVFISYSHEGENRDHIQWVQDLAQKITLHADVRVILDQNGLGAGDNKYQFMDPILKTAEKVLMIFTPDYKFKAEARKPGLGYEYALIIEELLHTMLSNKKYIPVLKSGSMEQSVPIFMHQFIAVDMRDPALFEIGFRDLMAAILDKPPSKGRRSAGFFRGTDSMPGNLPDRTPPGNKPVIPDQGVLSELGKFIPIINIGKDLLSAISEFEKAQELPGTAEPTTHEHDHSNDPLNISHVEHFLPDPVNPHDDWDVGHSEYDDTADDNHSDSLNYDPQDDC